MKKGLGGIRVAVLGAALAMGGGLGTPAQTAQAAQQQNQMMAPEYAPEIMVVKNRQTGGIRMRLGWGTSPKAYGMWLQSRRRQVWTRPGGGVSGRTFGKQVVPARMLS